MTLPHTASLPHTDLPRVLVVDDDRDAADMLAQLLCLNGIDARPAFGGRQAVDLAATFDPDVVFLDLGMPVMDGFEVIRALRTDLGSSAYIVALTAWDDARTLARVASAGFDRHMAKPSGLAAILRVIAGHYRNGKLQQESAACQAPSSANSRQAELHAGIQQSIASHC